MGIVDYKDLTKLSNYVGIKGDYTALEEFFDNLDCCGFISVYNNIKEQSNAVVATRCLSAITELIDYNVEDVLEELSKDKDLVKYLNDRRCKSNFILEKLKSHIVGEEKIEQENTNNKKGITYTYHGFIFEMSDKKIVRILFTKNRYNILKEAAKTKNKDTITELLGKYGINPNFIVSTKMNTLKLSKSEKDAIVCSLKSGIKIAIACRFLNQINYNYGIVSKNELEKGLSSETIDKLFGEPDDDNTLEIENNKKEKSKYKTRIKFDRKTGIIKDLGVQELFIGQPLNICCIFNISDPSSYIANIPKNDFIAYDHITGVINPIKPGKIAISIKNIFDNQIRKIVLSVNPSLKHSLNNYASKKKKVLIKEKNNQ